MNTTRIKTEFRLGGIFSGKTFYYTDLPTFRTYKAAVEFQARRVNRSAHDVIFRCVDLGWGLKTETLPATA